MTGRALRLDLPRIVRDARAFHALPTVEKAFFSAAFALAPWASLAVRHVELRVLLRALSKLPLVATRAELGVERGESLVRRAFRRAPTDERCLPEAVVQYLLHLRAGPAPRLVVGVRRDRAASPSLAAHAWIEENDGPRREPGFSPILELSSTRGLGQAA